MKFDFKNSPLYPLAVAGLGYAINQTETEIDNTIVAEFEEALEEAQNYDGDLEDLLDKLFDTIRWALNLIPFLKKKKWDDILINVAEYLTDLVIKRNGEEKGIRFGERLKARVQAKREVRNG